MAKEIIWTKRAVNAYNKVIDYLLKEWSVKDANHFILITQKVVDVISENPKSFRELEEKNHHEALVTQHNLLIYEIRNNKVYILTFWDTRTNPKNRKV